MLDIVIPDMDGMQLIQWLINENHEDWVLENTNYSPNHVTHAKLPAEASGLLTSRL